MIEIVLRQPAVRTKRSPYHPISVSLEEDLQSFLWQLENYPAIAEFGNLDVYGRVPIANPWLASLAQDLAKLLEFVVSSPDELSVPSRVGLTSDEDIPREFGLDRFREWLLLLFFLVTLAMNDEGELFAVGN